MKTMNSLDFSYHIEQLSIEILYNLETFVIGDGIDEDVSMDAYGVLGRERGVLILAGRVHQF